MTTEHNSQTPEFEETPWGALLAFSLFVMIVGLSLTAAAKHLGYIVNPEGWQFWVLVFVNVPVLFLGLGAANTTIEERQINRDSHLCGVIGTLALLLLCISLALLESETLPQTPSLTPMVSAGILFICWMSAMGTG